MIEWMAAPVIVAILVSTMALVGILCVLSDISGHLRKIAERRNGEIGITVPGNRHVTVQLPDGTITAEGYTHGTDQT